MEAISLRAQELFSILGFPITNGFFMTLIVSALLIVFSFAIQKSIRIIPGKLQGTIEMGMVWFLEVMHSTLGSRQQAEKCFPLVATIFIFIWCSNVLGIFPGVGSLHLGEAPLLRSPAADLNFTLAFAVISVLMSNVLGAAAVGTFAHIGKYLNFKNPIRLFIGLLEIVSELAKIISLSFRLFGNVFAGEVLLMIIAFLAPYFVPLPFLFLELFVGLIQAFLFAMLTLVSISLHTAIHESH